MKTKEELNALKNEVEVLNAKLAELTEEELAQVTGGSNEYDEYGLIISGGEISAHGSGSRWIDQGPPDHDIPVCGLPGGHLIK